ncbi:protein Shroom1 [Pithys albifrons albifrons]|uniref:protein Shroom1 n=1 Tax=Pithys albifrons albifrons TaxID=3385563 RepID=UPI003A5CBC70
MASSGNAVGIWARRAAGTGELAQPGISPENEQHLPPEKSSGSTDHPWHLPGRADCAYSSFSGGSNAPECPTLSPPLEQEPYMDSQYVRGISNLSAGAHELRPHHPPRAPHLRPQPSPASSSAPGHSGIPPSSRAPEHSGIPASSRAPECPEIPASSRAPECPGIPASSRAPECPGIPASSRAPECPGIPASSSPPEHSGIPPTKGTSHQGVLPLAAPAPSPPSQLGTYSILRHLGRCRGRASSGGRSECEVQDRELAHSNGPWAQHWDGVTDTRPARKKTLENQSLSSDSTNEASTSNIQGLKTEENGEWCPRQQPTKRRNPHVFSRPSSFIFQEYLKTDSVVNVLKTLSAYNSVHANKIPKEMNSQSCHPAHSKPSTVNDTQEGKQCPCGVQKPNARGAALPSTVPGSCQRKGSLPCAQDLLCAQWHPDMDQDVFEDSGDLKYMENALLIKNASRKLNSCTDGNQCCGSGGKAGRDVREAVLGQQGWAVPCSCQAEAQHQGPGQGREQGWHSTSQVALLRPKKDSTSQLGREVQKGKQFNNSSPDLSTCLEQEEPPAGKHQPAPHIQPREDPAGEQITRQVTPLLYYLSGGKPTHSPQPSKLSPSQEHSRGSPKEIPSSSSAASARGPEVQRERQQPQRPCQPRGHRAEQLLLHTQDLSPAGPASLTEETFRNDYREQLKVAQKKVLRETSFKRKDLQMSLPVRLRQKPSKRPSIEHLRSFSLSSASEDAKPAPSHLESLQSFSREEEIRRPQTGQAGGRKKVTKEEKKLCYSEPEKLDQLMDKELSWSQVRDEVTEQDIMAARRRALENGGRALSSSSMSRTELKQIQHTALLEYMERKISRRAGVPQHLPLHQPPLQKRLSHPSGHPGKTPDPEGSRKMQNDEVFCQVFSREKSPDVFPAWAAVAPLSVSSRNEPSKAHGSCPAAERPPWEGHPGAGTAQGTAKATPPATQDTCRCASCASCAAAPPQSCASSPSFHDPEEAGAENHRHEDTAGHGHEDMAGHGHEDTAGHGHGHEDTAGRGHEDTAGHGHEDTAGRGHEDTAGRGHEDTAGHGHEDTAGHGHEDTAGHGHEDTAGHGHEDTAGRGHEDTPGHGHEDTPGHGHEDTPGHGHEDTAGRGHEDTAGHGHEDTAGHGHGHEDTAGHGRVCCHDTEELTPETSIPAPGGGSRESPGVEMGCRAQSLGGNAALGQPEQGMHLHTALAQPLQGDNNPAKGLGSQADVPLETGTHLPRRRLQCPHDQRCQELVLEIIAKDRSLVHILMPHPDRKTALDLMEGLFPVNISMLDKSHRKKGNVQHVQEDDRKSHRDGSEECPEPENEAKQRSKDPASKGNQVLDRIRGSTKDPDDITSKKLELMGRLRTNLQSLWQEREQVLQESRECAQLGEGLEATVRGLCKPNEVERYLMFIGDLEKVVNLLLCLSSRLARVQNALSRVDGSTDAEEKHSLWERLQLLSRQREDAKELKEHLERRGRVVSAILARYLTEQQLHNYQHFVQAKTSLLIEQKDLEEQMKFLEEQIETLEQSLPL